MEDYTQEGMPHALGWPKAKNIKTILEEWKGVQMGGSCDCAGLFVFFAFVPTKAISCGFLLVYWKRAGPTFSFMCVHLI